MFPVTLKEIVKEMSDCSGYKKPRNVKSENDDGGGKVTETNVEKYFKETSVERKGIKNKISLKRLRRKD